MSLIQLVLSSFLEYNLSFLTLWMVQLTNVLAYHLLNRVGDSLFYSEISLIQHKKNHGIIQHHFKSEDAYWSFIYFD